MASTYSLSSDRGKVRFELSDTDEFNAEFNDAEIDHLLTEESSNVLLAAARGAEVLSLCYAKDPNFTADGVTVQGTARAKHWASLALQLRNRARGGVTSVQTRHDDGYQGQRDVDHRDSENLLTSNEVGS